MNREELTRFIEHCGYQFLGLVEWKKSFRVRYQCSRYKISQHFKIPLSEIPSQNDGSNLWFDFGKAIGKEA